MIQIPSLIDHSHSDGVPSMPHLSLFTPIEYFIFTSDFHNSVDIGIHSVFDTIVYSNHFCAKDPGPEILDTFDYN